MASLKDHANVVKPLLVRNPDHPPRLHSHRHRLIVTAPIVYIIKALDSKVIQRVGAFIPSSWTKPATRGFSRRRRNGFFYLSNHRAFFFQRILIDPNVIGHAVSQPFPLTLVALFDDGRMISAHVGVQQHRRAYPMLVEHIHHTENTNPRSIIPQSITSDIRQL